MLPGGECEVILFERFHRRKAAIRHTSPVYVDDVPVFFMKQRCSGSPYNSILGLLPVVTADGRCAYKAFQLQLLPGERHQSLMLQFHHHATPLQNES